MWDAPGQTGIVRQLNQLRLIATAFPATIHFRTANADCESALQKSDVPFVSSSRSDHVGIVSEDLKPGQKLPSTRELAHRYDIHSNTVSAAYRELAHRGWVEFRKGNGVYVRDRVADAPADASLELDQLISTLFKIARERGYSVREIQSRVKRWLKAQPPDHFLVIEPDVEMRNVLIAEIEEATGFRAIGASIRDCAKPEALAGAAPVAMYGVAEQSAPRCPRKCLRISQTSAHAGFNGGQQRPSPTRSSPWSAVAGLSSWLTRCGSGRDRSGRA